MLRHFHTKGTGRSEGEGWREKEMNESQRGKTRLRIVTADEEALRLLRLLRLTSSRAAVLIKAPSSIHAPKSEIHLESSGTFF